MKIFQTDLIKNMNTISNLVVFTGVVFIVYSFGELIKYLKAILIEQLKIKDSLIYVHLKLNYLTSNTTPLKINTRKLNEVVEDIMVDLSSEPPSVLFKDDYQSYKNQLLDLELEELTELKETFIKNQWYEELNELDKAIKYVRTNKEKRNI